MDVAFVALAALFLVAALGLAYGCAALQRRGLP
jgi:hypothetical protein